MEKAENNIFERMLTGSIIDVNDPEIKKVWEIVAQTIKLSAELSASSSINESRRIASNIIGETIDDSTTIFVPFYTNFGKHIRLGKRVFINHACSFLDLGGIMIEDDVQIGPRVNLVTENHPVSPQQRKNLDLKPILVKRNAWIGAGATILPGVTIGENAIVAAGALVNKDVAPNTIVAGVPAKFIRAIQ